MNPIIFDFTNSASIAILVITLFSFAYFSYLFKWKLNSILSQLLISIILSATVWLIRTDLTYNPLVLFSAMLISVTLALNLVSWNFMPLFAVSLPIYLAIFLYDNLQSNLIALSLSISIILWAISISLKLLANPFVKYPLIKRTNSLPLSYSKSNETARQLFHIFLGFFVLAIYLFFGKFILISVLFVGLLFGIFLFNLKNNKGSIYFFELFLSTFSRPGEVAGMGSLTYLLGVIFSLTSISNIQYALAVVLILAVGDGFSTLIGRKFGKNKIFYNEKKTFEGLFSFVIFSIIMTYFLIGSSSILLSIILGIVETLPIANIDDNLTIPIAGFLMSLFV